eukprot:scaffold6499_cov134-Skeletonema_marinoi.AAC.1
MELLVNGVPSRSINKSLLSFIHLMTNGDTDYTIEELPSVWYIRRVRTMLLTVTQVLAAYRLGKAKKWGQLHTDMTSRRQVHFLDLLLSYSDGDSDNEHEYKTVLMSCCIFPEDETAKQQIESIDNFLKEQGALLEEWKLVIEKMYPDYAHDIPDAASLDLGKLADGGVVTTDTFNSAKSVMRMMIELIIERGKNNDTMLTVLESVVEEVANGEVDAADNDGEQINVEERRNVLACCRRHHDMHLIIMSVMPPSPAMPQLRLSAAFILLLLLINFLSSLAPVNGLYISSLTYCNKPHHHHHNICRHIIAKPMTRHRSDPFEKERVKRAKNVKRDLTKILLAMEEWNQAEDSVLADLLQKWHAQQQKSLLTTFSSK